MKSVAKKVKASCLYLFRRLEPVGFAPDGLASAAFVAVAVAAAARVAQEPPVAAEVVRVAPVADALADPAHVASAVAVAADLHVAPAGYVPEPIRDAFVVLVAASAVAVVPVLRLVHLAVVVAQVLPHVQLALRLHARLDAARFAGVVAPAQCAVVRVAR